MKPPEFIVKFLKIVRSFFPYAAIAPVPDLIDKCFKNNEMALLARKDPIAYKKPPRLQSAVAMMRCTDQIAAHMEDLVHPVLILHGEADVVTAPGESHISAIYAKSRIILSLQSICRESNYFLTLACSLLPIPPKSMQKVEYNILLFA